MSPRAIRPSEDLDRGASPVKLRMMHLSNRLAGLQDELDAEKKVANYLRRRTLPPSTQPKHIQVILLTRSLTFADYCR